MLEFKFKEKQSKNEILAFLEKGNVKQRIDAILSLSPKLDNFDLAWEIYLSDEDKEVRGNALCLAIHCIMKKKPNKIFEILKEVMPRDCTLVGMEIRQVCLHLLEMYEKKLIEIVKR